MARDTFENWIPEEKGSKPFVKFAQKSVVDALGAHEPMAGDTKQVPRDGGFTVTGVAKGSAYGESTSTNDYVELIARKIGGIERVADEDLNDSAVNILETKRIAAARSMAIFFDNAAIATTGVGNGTTKLYNSLYYTLTQADSTVGYTANANLIQTAGAADYDDFSNALALVEASDWVDESQIAWMIHPAFRGFLRELKDTQGRPMFLENMRGDNGYDSLFSYPIRWSRGLKTSSTNSQAPSGNPLAVVGDTSKLLVGDAKLPGLAAGVMGTQLQDSRNGVGYTTDESLMKAAMRKGFAVGFPDAFAIIEKTS